MYGHIDSHVYICWAFIKMKKIEGNYEVGVDNMTKFGDNVYLIEILWISDEKSIKSTTSKYSALRLLCKTFNFCKNTVQLKYRSRLSSRSHEKPFIFWSDCFPYFI